MVSGNLFGVAGKIRSVVTISVVEAVTNLTLSVILVQICGIVGVLIATVAALPLKLIYCNYMADKVILKRSLFKTLTILGINWGIFSVVVLINPLLNLHITSYFSFALCGCVVFAVISIVSVVLNVIVNRDLLRIKMFFSAKKDKKKGDFDEI